MIFRKDLDNRLYEIEPDIDMDNIEEINAFLNEQNTSQSDLEFIYVPDEELPDNIYPITEALYKINSDTQEIELDVERMLSEYKQSLISSVNNTRDFYIASGFDWTRTTTDTDGNQIETTYHFGLTQDYINGMLSLATAVLLGKTTDLYFITTDNITVDNLTPEEVTDLALTGEAQASYIIYQARQYKDAIAAASSFDELYQLLTAMKEEAGESGF